MNQNSKRTLVEEIIENARKDRQRLESVADGLMDGFGTLGDGASIEDGNLDPEVSAAFAEELAKVTDSLSKINQQLIELVKVESKKEENNNQDKQKTKFSKEEKEALYEELQAEGLN